MAGTARDDAAFAEVRRGEDDGLREKVKEKDGREEEREDEEEEEDDEEEEAGCVARAGRRRTSLAPVTDARRRREIFTKRRRSVLKKALELSVMCDSDVGVFIVSEHGSVYEFCSNSHQIAGASQQSQRDASTLSDQEHLNDRMLVLERYAAYAGPFEQYSETPARRNLVDRVSTFGCDRSLDLEGDDETKENANPKLRVQKLNTCFARDYPCTAAAAKQLALGSNPASHASAEPSRSRRPSLIASPSVHLSAKNTVSAAADTTSAASPLIARRETRSSQTCVLRSRPTQTSPAPPVSSLPSKSAQTERAASVALQLQSRHTAEDTLTPGLETPHPLHVQIPEHFSAFCSSAKASVFGTPRTAAGVLSALCATPGWVEPHVDPACESVGVQTNVHDARDHQMTARDRESRQ
mmetsp:Transcript_1268/g.3519  ORF Transcript_1268/g.3519 Transcript_1268/m.3519 type:complete len:411 (-) Transcript_1268:894-2126(-)